MNGEYYYAVHEMYYELGEPQDKGWTENPAEAIADSVEDLRETLQRMLDATYKPLLNFEDGAIIETPVID